MHWCLSFRVIFIKVVKFGPGLQGGASGRPGEGEHFRNGPDNGKNGPVSGLTCPPVEKREEWWEDGLQWVGTGHPSWSALNPVPWSWHFLMEVMWGLGRSFDAMNTLSWMSIKLSEWTYLLGDLLHIQLPFTVPNRLLTNVLAPLTDFLNGKRTQRLLRAVTLSLSFSRSNWVPWYVTLWDLTIGWLLVKFFKKKKVF